MRRLASISFDVPAFRPGTVGAYIFAFLCAGAATALRLAIDPYIVGVQFITFFPAVIITTLISGFGAGLFCVVLSAIAATFFVLPPRLSFYIDHPGEIAGVLLFVLVTLSNVILVAGLRFAVERYKERVEKERLLMREVNHRAKNMLSVVDAIAHQTAAQNPRISPNISPSVSRHCQPIRTCLFGTNGEEWRSRTWCEPSWRTSPTSSALVLS
jgi:K+-sensing histidine kinase KdpD